MATHGVRSRDQNQSLIIFIVFFLTAQSMPAIAFSVRPSTSDPQGTSTSDYDDPVLIWTDVLLNEGSAYSTSTGRFTAPVTGTYFFSAMAVAAAVPSDSGWQSADLYLRTNSKGMDGYLFSSSAYSDGPYGQTGSLQGAVHLKRHEQVWLTTESTNPNNRDFRGDAADAAFSGFLIFVEE